MKYLVSIILLILSVHLLNAQCNNSGAYFPIYAEYDDDYGDAESKYSWSSGIYNLSQIGSAGNINSITFLIEDPVTVNDTYSNQEIWMRHTSINSYTNDDYPGTTGFVRVYIGDIQISGANFSNNGYCNVVLDNAFNYNGTDNLEILFLNKSGFATSEDVFFYSTNYNASLSNRVGKYGASYISFSEATSNGGEGGRKTINTALGFNTSNSVNCNSFESTLPITLQAFDLNTEKDLVTIEWSTQSEVNNAYFTLEHSTDGLNYNMIKELKGAGNSNTKKSYSYIDKSATDGLNYYRLKQTDFDGRYKYFYSKSINITSHSLIRIFPNPAKDVVYVKSNERINKLELYDITGSLIYKQNNINSRTYILHRKDLRKGTYLLKINETNYQKLIFE